MAISNKEVQIVKTDFNISKFKEKTKKIDLDLLTKAWDTYDKYTIDELAMISYKLDKVSKENAPMLFEWFKRIFTYDIPIKLLDFFDVQLNVKPNDYWFVEKKEIPLYKKFLADNWITWWQFNRWKKKYENKKEWEFFIRAVELSWQWLENFIVNWTAMWLIQPTYWVFLSKNILWMVDNVNITQKIELATENFKDLSELSTEELQEMLTNPNKFASALKELSSWEIEEELIETKPIDENNVIIDDTITDFKEWLVNKENEAAEMWEIQ